ncbi:MAG: sulfotransferase [Candidatus Tectimicrobiota bacterium]
MNHVAALLQRTNLGYQFGLIGFARLSNLLRLAHYMLDIHPRYLLRLLLLVSSSVCSVPLRLWERLAYGRRIAQVRLEKPPIFIIGHWRSGTTHLHNVLSQDPALGYVTMYQAMVPNCSLVGDPWLKHLLAHIMPSKRPMDNMVWPMDAPQEEEIPLSKMMPRAFYTQFLFPRKAPMLFAKYVLLQGASARVIAEFKRQYFRLLQVATLHAGGRQLLLKNPVNTARVRLLLDMFPNAKFIHIHRSPYEVFASTQHLHRTMLSVTTLQRLRAENATERIVTLYEDMMRRFLADRALIPAQNLVEVRFEDLERDPLHEVQRVYSSLGLPGYAEAEPAFRAYIASQRAYRKNTLSLSAADRQQIEQRWAFAFTALGYAQQGAYND